MSEEEQTCDTCKFDLLKSSRYPCNECHWLYMDKWEPKEEED